MVMLYVGGKYVGKLPEDAGVLTEYVASGHRVEWRDESGAVVARTIPDPEPLVPWDHSITKEDLDRIRAEPGLAFEEVRKRLGWG